MAHRNATVEDDGRLNSGEIDLRALGRGVWRRKRWILGPTLLAALAAFAFVQLSAPHFRSSALVLIENREGAVPRPGAEREAPLPDEQAVQTQVQLIQSRDLVRSVVKSLDLGRDPEFGESGDGFWRKALRAVGLSGAEDRLPPAEKVVDRVAAKLTVYPITGSRVVGLEFTSRNPDSAARIVNGFVDAYLDIQRAAKRDANRQTSQYLADEIEKLRGRVTEAEDKVEAFRAKAGLLVGTNNTTLANQQLGDATVQLSTARTQQAEARAKADNIRDVLRQGRPAEALDIANSDLIRQLAQRRSELAAQIASESRTLLPQHPRMRELAAQLAGLDEQVKGEAEKLARAFENDARTAGARVAALEKRQAELKTAAAAANGEDVRLRAIERDARSQRDLLEQMLARYREATARDNPEALLADARVISRGAAPTEAYFPKKGPTVALTALAAFALALFFAASAEVFGSRAPETSRLGGPLSTRVDAPTYVRVTRPANGGSAPLQPVRSEPNAGPPAPLPANTSTPGAAAAAAAPSPEAPKSPAAPPAAVPTPEPVATPAAAAPQPGAPAASASDAASKPSAVAPAAAALASGALVAASMKRSDSATETAARPKPSTDAKQVPMKPSDEPEPAAASKPEKAEAETARPVGAAVEKPSAASAPQAADETTVADAAPSRLKEAPEPSPEAEPSRPTPADPMPSTEAERRPAPAAPSVGAVATPEARPTASDDSTFAEGAPAAGAAAPLVGTASVEPGAPPATAASEAAPPAAAGPGPARPRARSATIECADATLINALARQLAAMPMGDGALRILVTGSQPDLAVPAVAAKLSSALSSAGRRVVVVDAGGGGGPGGEAEQGLSDLLTGGATFAQAIHRDQGSRVHVVPRGGAAFAALDAGAQARLGTVVEALALTYDFVVLTAPSGPGGADAFARHCAAAVLVSTAHAADLVTVEAHERLKAAGVEDVVVILVNGGDGSPRGRSSLAAA